jgi:hypothetical protein
MLELPNVAEDTRCGGEGATRCDDFGGAVLET